MIIQCTSCEKKFNVPDSAITAAGRLVQCSSCGNKWTQYPIEKKAQISSTQVNKPPIAKSKKISKKKNPIPYSEEYINQKWGSSIKNYVDKKGLNKKISKSKKQSTNKEVSFGFFNYIIMFFVSSTFLIGILSFERSRISRKFPFLDPYINSFFESIEIFKFIILDFFR